MRRREGGQALTEFALIAPLLFLILFGIIQLGFMLGGQNGLTNATREAARYASTLPTPDTIVAGNCGTSVNTTSAGLVYDRLVKINMLQYIPGYQAGNVVKASPLSACGAAAAAGTATGIQYCRLPVDGSTSAVFVRVTVVYKHPLFIPLVGRFFGSSNTWTGTATEFMRVEGPNRSSTSPELVVFPSC
jgi:hypothetical protein